MGDPEPMDRLGWLVTAAVVFSVAVFGCNAVSTWPVDDPVDTNQIAFDAAACAEALARQAELANESPAFKASEVLDGILTQGAECGIPADFAGRVRKACPAIGAKPADISKDQVDAIRGVR